MDIQTVLGIAIPLAIPAIGVIFQLGRIMSRVEALERQQALLLEELRMLRQLWDRRHD